MIPIIDRYSVQIQYPLLEYMRSNRFIVITLLSHKALFCRPSNFTTRTRVTYKRNCIGKLTFRRLEILFQSHHAKKNLMKRHLFHRIFSLNLFAVGSGLLPLFGQTSSLWIISSVKNIRAPFISMS